MTEYVRWGTIGLAWMACGIMWWANHKMSKAYRMTRTAAFSTSVAAANMWDTLTPEQIRTLHPFTVEIANQLPSWHEVEPMLRPKT